MSNVSSLLRGSIVITAGRVCGYMLSFTRNIILARFLGSADFGLAVMFATAISLLEIATRMAFGPQLIQAKDGNSEEFQATSHVFQFILAIAGALAIWILSGPLAQALRVPQHSWAFMLLSIIPFARGLEHLDSFRQQREMHFLPAALCEVLPQALITVAAWPIAMWCGDFRAIVWLMTGKAICGTLVTHAVAKRRYIWGWNREYALRMWIFGWPLLLTSLAMFAALQADQLIVGVFVSVSELASYALALSIVAIPWFIFGQAASAVMLPILSRVQDSPEQFSRYHRLCVQCAGVGAVVSTLPLIVAGEQVIRFLYGAKYGGAGALVALLGAASAIRFLRFVPAVAAMARADTLNQLYSNLWRGISLPLTGAVAFSGGGVLLIAACPLLAEIIATLFSVTRLKEHQGIPLCDYLKVAIYLSCSLGPGLALVWLGSHRWEISTVASVAAVLTGMSLVAGWLIFPEAVHQLTIAISGATRQRQPNTALKSVV